MLFYNKQQNRHFKQKQLNLQQRTTNKHKFPNFNAAEPFKFAHNLATIKA
jgi:hypothetical protein